MQQAKFALAIVIVFSIVGGALAFKSNKQSKTFYALTTTIVNGQLTKGCVQPVQLFYTCDPNGTTKIVNVSCTTLIPTTLCEATVRRNA